ncbi:hypothetical protein FHG87_006865 [Trinorchestia longiramus]|nr:hypothetical protein FHG87_006865 [Trinorchestia longiramus]
MTPDSSINPLLFVQAIYIKEEEEEQQEGAGIKQSRNQPSSDIFKSAVQLAAPQLGFCEQQAEPSADLDWNAVYANCIESSPSLALQHEQFQLWAPSTMLTAQELGWLVVVSSLVLGLAFCLGICLALWCRKASGGGHKMAPVTMLDPIDEKNGKPPSHASMLLPSVTLSEFGSEPRTPLSSVTPTSGASQQFHWSVGRGTPRPLSPVHYSNPTTLSQGTVSLCRA